MLGYAYTVLTRLLQGAPHGRFSSLQGLFKSRPPMFEGGRVWGVLLKITQWFRERRYVLSARYAELADPEAGADPNNNLKEEHDRIYQSALLGLS